MKKKVKPSQTALKVALNIIALENVEKMKEVLPEGIVDKTVQLLINSNATNLRRIEKHQSPKIVNLYKKFDWLLPGQFEAMGYRKAAFETAVRDAIKNGALQVLVLGSGVKFFEIDHPDTAIYKTEGVDKLGKANNHFILHEDLSKKQLRDVLDKYEYWEKNAKSIITAEGLLQYLPPSSVSELFEQCKIISGNGSKIAFTYVGQAANGKPDAGPKSKLMLWILKTFGEAWLWSTKENDLRKLLFSNDWKMLNGENQNKKLGVEYFTMAEQI